MKKATQFTLCTLVILTLISGVSYAQFPQEGDYIEQVVGIGMGSPPANLAQAPPVRNGYSAGYGHPASAGYSARPMMPAHPQPGPAMARSVGYSPGNGIDPGMMPSRRISKCKPDQAGACGPRPYPSPYAGMPCGPLPLPCGPVCIPDQVNWY